MQINDRITITRTSVCAGDSVNAPNAYDLEYNSETTFKDLMPQIIKYLPKQPDSLWSILYNDKYLAFIACDSDKTISIDIIQPGLKISEIFDPDLNGTKKGLFCRYSCRYEYNDKYDKNMSIVNIKNIIMDSVFDINNKKLALA